MMFVDCPACLDHDQATQCGLPAEVSCRFTMRSTDGPLDSATIRCLAGHHFSGPLALLTPARTGHHDPGPGPARPGPRAGPDRQPGPGGPHRDGAPARPDVPAGPPLQAGRPPTAPAYYLGRPAAQWITALRPRRTLRIPAR